MALPLPGVSFSAITPTLVIISAWSLGMAGWTKSIMTAICWVVPIGAWAQSPAYAPAPQEPTYLPPPIVEEAPLPSWYFSMDLAVVQPRLKAANVDGQTFSPRLDWTISPRFEFGLVNRGRWNPYVGFRSVYSDAAQEFIEMDTLTVFARSTELHAIDLGAKSEVFPFLSVLQAQWDLSARIAVTDFRDAYHLEFFPVGFFAAHQRQQFVGAGPRTGLKLELPFRDTGWSLGGNAEASLMWGGYRATIHTEFLTDDTFEEEFERRSKGGILWQVGGQLALQYKWPVCDPRIVYSMGYQYDAWFSKDIGSFIGSDFGRFDYHGPFVRFEWRY